MKDSFIMIMQEMFEKFINSQQFKQHFNETSQERVDEIINEGRNQLLWIKKKYSIE